MVCKSFHGAGIVVPLDKDTEVGYREVPETDGEFLLDTVTVDFYLPDANKKYYREYETWGALGKAGAHPGIC